MPPVPNAPIAPLVVILATSIWRAAEEAGSVDSPAASTDPSPSSASACSDVAPMLTRPPLNPPSSVPTPVAE